MIPRRRHTRDGTRRRFAADLLAAFRGHRADPRDPAAPRSADDPATQETAASDAATAAASAAALGDTATARAAAKDAARAAALARSGANATRTAAGAAAAASAESFAMAAIASVEASLSTYTTNAPECRTRGGTATLIGHDEFTSPSSPPKRFRTLTISGTLVICNYGNFSTCGSGPHPSTNGQYSYRYSGAVTYHVSTGAITDTTLKESDNANVFCGDAPSYSNNGHVSSAVESTTSGTALNKTTTQTTRVQTSDLSCVSGGILHSPYPEAVTSVSNRDDLSDEDTENDAIARLQAAASWSSWSAANSTSCKASYEQRTSGFSFAYTEAAFRDTISIPSGQTGILKVGLYRRTRGSSDPWVHYATEVFFLTGDGSNQDTIEFTYAADPGYEAYAAGLPVGS